MAEGMTVKRTEKVMKTYPRDSTDPENKVWKVFKNGKWVRIPYLRKFNPNYHLKIHPGQILPIWYYKFQDRSELFVVEIQDGILYFHSDRPEEGVEEMPLVEVQILNIKTLQCLIEQALMQHTRFRAIIHRKDGQDSEHSRKMADECNILFIRLVYERAVKMGINPETLEQRDIELHRKWLQELQPKVGHTAFTNFLLNFEAEPEKRKVIFISDDAPITHQQKNQITEENENDGLEVLRRLKIT